MEETIPQWRVNNPIKRRLSAEVRVGNLGIGGHNPIRVQSMTNTDTMDTNATVEQCIRLADVGCEMVRITASNVQAAENLYNIKNALAQRNYNIPLIADIHFNPKAAEVAAGIVEKVRINPGNYTDRNTSERDYSDRQYREELERIAERLQPLVEICKANHTAMRIGTNHGSLSRRIMNRFGDTPYAMAVSAMEFVQICHQMGYDDLVLSMKSSNVKVMNFATRTLVALMQQSNLNYPVHLGVTEAGNGADGRIKSMSGIGSLLAIGIGDTIRVSLTEKPENEIPVARQIVDAYKDMPFESIGEEYALSSVFCRNDIAQSQENIKTLDLAQTKFDDCLQIASKKDNVVRLVQTKECEDKALLAGNVAALVMEGGVCSVSLIDKEFEADLMQAVGERIYKAEFIACPSCGRTKYDIQTALEKVKQRCKHLKGLKIAVMGCIVNGPGEMSDADYGYIGSRENRVHLYRNGKLVYSNVEDKDALDLLVSMIKEDGKWQDEN